MRDYDKFRKAYKRLRTLNRDTAKELLKAISDEPCITQLELIEDTGLEQSVVSLCIRELEKMGIVHREKHGKHVLHVANYDEIGRINKITSQLAKIYDAGTELLATDIEVQIQGLQSELQTLRQAV